mmetsp:Transcript_21491/g.51633  ORF Transcript_21491/g.51633 Transcript_21491/m.51633 type:complete len:227 (-) Transcript_21491:707-1387(-)
MEELPQLGEQLLVRFARLAVRGRHLVPRAQRRPVVGQLEDVVAGVRLRQDPRHRRHLVGAHRAERHLHREHFRARRRQPRAARHELDELALVRGRPPLEHRPQRVTQRRALLQLLVHHHAECLLQREVLLLVGAVGDRAADRRGELGWREEHRLQLPNRQRLREAAAKRVELPAARVDEEPAERRLDVLRSRHAGRLLQLDERGEVGVAHLVHRLQRARRLRVELD